MPIKPPIFRPSSAQTEREYEAERRGRLPWRAWYKLPIWQALRSAQLTKQPLCETCLPKGLVTLATVAHHKRPHQGKWSLFIDPNNLASACKPCHDSVLQSEDRQGEGGVESWQP